jgi:mRNA interferase YafQ
MRTIKPVRSYKRDYKRERSGRFGPKLEDMLRPVIEMLATDETLPQRFCDHSLEGNWKGHRECHVRPDLLLIYRKPDADSLELVRLGSHSELY